MAAAASTGTIPAEAFFLDPAFEGTLQQQIQQLVAEGILSGRFRPGERMPSSRGLAQHLGISRITVTIAYTELVANDYLTARGRSGYYVSDAAPVPPNFAPAPRSTRPQVDWSRALGQRYAGMAVLERPADWRRYPYPFIYGQVDPRLFDHQNWRLCALQALGQKDFDALTADHYERDDPLLVEYILRHILPRRGIWARPEEILVTLGAQNALWIAAQILLTQRRLAAMENPCYPGLREILSPTRCRTVAIDVDQDGLPPEAVPADTDVLFVTVSHQCPTNTTMPVERRRALLARAERDGFIIVEDDYEFEIAYGQAASPALKSLDETGAVVHIGSFSKSIFPGLRLGYLVASEAFVNEARALRSLVLRHPPGHVQRTAAYFLSLGHYDAQVNRMAQTFRQRRKVMEGALQEHALDRARPARFGASSAWLQMPAGTDTAALARRLRQDGVLVEPGGVFFQNGARAGERDRRHLRLAYSSIAAESIPEGVSRIARHMASTGLSVAV
ncbi:MAG: PLP-dependent aminotransferase family protein [Pseudomonadota bacterium]